MIKVVNLKKQFGDNVVLKDISVTVTPGEAISVIGPSGSGKSTFLRCINGLEEITDGHIYVDELDIADPKVNIDTLRERVGMVFQSFNLFPHLSVTDNITLAPITLNKMSKADANKKAIELLKKVGLEDKAEVFPSSLSGGQKQRAGIARALAPRPHVMLADEPTSALDPATTKSVLACLKDINEKFNVTIVIVTHEMSVIRRLCNRVALLDKGKLLEVADVRDGQIHASTPIGQLLINED